MIIKVGGSEFHLEQEIQFAGADMTRACTVTLDVVGNTVEIKTAPGEACSVPSSFVLRINGAVALSSYTSALCKGTPLEVLHSVLHRVHHQIRRPDFLKAAMDYISQDPENAKKILVIQTVLEHVSPKSDRPARGNPEIDYTQRFRGRGMNDLPDAPADHLIQ